MAVPTRYQRGSSILVVMAIAAFISMAAAASIALLSRIEGIKSERRTVANALVILEALDAYTFTLCTESGASTLLMAVDDVNTLISEGFLDRAPPNYLGQPFEIAVSATSPRVMSVSAIMGNNAIAERMASRPPGGVSASRAANKVTWSMTSRSGQDESEQSMREENAILTGVTSGCH